MATDPATDARLRRVEDELAIRALAARFADCANEGDLDGFADLWSARAVWEIGPPLPARAEGVNAIVGMLRKLLAPRMLFVQMTHSGIAACEGDLAVARFIGCERGRGETDFYENLTVYDDHLVRELDRRWRFARRVHRYRYLHDAASSGRVFPLTADRRGADAQAARDAGVHA